MSKVADITSYESQVEGGKNQNRICSCFKRTSKNRLRSFPDNVELMGLQPIFDETSPIARRILWTFVVLFGVGFAVYQICSQIMLYLSYPVTVYVNISHVDQLPFPRVVICNYNYMRKSAFSMNLTGVDTTDVSGLFEPDIAAGVYNDTDWNQLYRRYAHPLNETMLKVMYFDMLKIKLNILLKLCKFIITHPVLLMDRFLYDYMKYMIMLLYSWFPQCSWQGVKCSPQNFTEIETDMGICYAFNDNIGGLYIHKEYFNLLYVVRYHHDCVMLMACC